MLPDLLPELLSAENRREALDLGLKLAGEEAGGAVLFGCGLSGRYEIALHAASQLPVERKHWVEIDVVAAPTDPSDFLSFLGHKILKQVRPDIPPGLVEQLQAIPSQKERFLRQELLKDALQALRKLARPTIIFRHLDVVETTHKTLDECFGALRDIMLHAGVYCFVTSYKDIRKSLTGVSHFANNFMTVRPHPVKLEEIEVAWGQGHWLEPGVVAQTLVKEYGFAERRVHQALQELKRLPGNPSNWAEKLKASAHKVFTRDAEKFYQQLDQNSQRVLKQSVRGHDCAPEHVELILSHDWAHYMLRAVSEERVEIFNSPLQAHVEAQLRKEAPNPSARLLEQAAQHIREEDPGVALALLSELEKASTLSTRQKEALRQLRALAHALDRVIHADYGQALSSLQGLGSTSDEGVRTLLAFWEKVIATNRDLPAFYDRGTHGELLERLAFDFARAERREKLKRWVDAFKDYMIVLESALQAVLAQRGWTKKQPAPKTSWPADALEQFLNDRKDCGHREPMTDLPPTFHGGLETLWLCRALNLCHLRQLRMKDANKLFALRTEVTHYSGQRTQEDVARAHELCVEVLTLISTSWGLARPDGKRHLWPESLIATLLKA